MSNVKWVGSPCGYTRSRAKKKRVDRWMVSVPVQRTNPQPMGADYWLCVIGVFLLCFAVMIWAALISA